MFLSVILTQGQIKSSTQEYSTFACTVGSGTDDVSENAKGEMTLDGNFLWLGGSTSGKLRAIRFENVNIPKNAVILDAYIEFYAYGDSPAASTNITAELGNPLTYSSSTNNISSRQYSQRQAKWTRSSSLTAKKVIRTPNLNNIIDESRSQGWQSGQSMAFRFEGLNTNQGLSVYAYEGGSTYRPQLIIKYHIDENFRFTDVSESTVSSSLDDGSEDNKGVMSMDGSFLWLGGSTSGNLRAIRFNNINIPATASIVDAYIEFFSYGDSPAASADIYTELGNPSTYSTRSNSISSRNYSHTKVTWDGAVSTAKQLVRTPNLQSIIDENREKGWLSGQSLAFKFKGLNANQGLNVYAYDGGASYCPKLVVRYLDDGNGPNAPLTLQVVESIVSAPQNDGSESNTGAMTLDGDFLWLGGSQSGHLRCIRFNNIDLPDNATVQNAYIEFYANGTSDDAKAYIYSQIGDAQIYTSSKSNMSSRVYSEKRIKWEAPVLSANQHVVTPTLKSIIDENRSKGWKSGQSMAFRFEGLSANEGIKIYSYEGTATYRPKLVIEYLQNEDQVVIKGAETDPKKMTLLRINEICSQGSGDQKEDWLELYNGHDFPLHIKGGIYLSDKKKTKTLAELKNIVIPAKGFYVFIADEQPENGKQYLPFDLKNSGETVYLSRSETDVMDEVTFGTVLYNQSYGRAVDGTGEFIDFMSPTHASSNKTGVKKIGIAFSHDRGLQYSAFDLTLNAPEGTTIRYTLDGKYPSRTVGDIYSGSIKISKTCVVKAISYDNNSCSDIESSTYVFVDNLNNEIVDKDNWKYKSTINSTDYANGISSLPIVSISTSPDVGEIYTEASVEFIDRHMYDPNSSEFDEHTNFFSNSMVRKFGNSSITYFNCGFKFKFTRDANARKATYPFFDPYENDSFPAPGKIHTLELKEGHDGPSSTFAKAGFNRFSEKVVMNLQKEMGKYALDTRYVNFFYNGKYRGVKTMRNDFKQQNLEEIFGDDSDNYTKVSLKTSTAVFKGGVEAGDGITAVWDEINASAKALDFQSFKKRVDVEDLVKFQIMYMFIDCESEAEVMVHNTSAPGYMKAKFNINDTDGAFFAGGQKGLSVLPVEMYQGGNYVYKWDSGNRNSEGVGGFIKLFRGTRKDPSSGNLEFKTIAKDCVLEAFGPISGYGAGDAKYPLSVQNVQNKIHESVAELDAAYKVDVAWAASAWASLAGNVYTLWKTKEYPRIIAQVPGRVSYSLNKWNECLLAHTLLAATINAEDVITSNTTITLTDLNSETQLYYTTDGSDPMGNDGEISSSAKKYSKEIGIKLSQGGYYIVVRPFKTNNWGPKTKKIITVSGSESRSSQVTESITSNTDMGIQIYPNPVSDLLYIETNSLVNNSFAAAIYSISGKLVSKHKLDSSINSINVADLPNGVYIIQVGSSNLSIQTFRFIKQ